MPEDETDRFVKLEHNLQVLREAVVTLKDITKIMSERISYLEDNLLPPPDDPERIRGPLGPRVPL